MPVNGYKAIVCKSIVKTGHFSNTSFSDKTVFRMILFLPEYVSVKVRKLQWTQVVKTSLTTVFGARKCQNILSIKMGLLNIAFVEVTNRQL